jgi:hypothetical protein
VIGAELRYCSSICLDRLRKLTWNLSKSWRLPGLVSNQVHPEYKPIRWNTVVLAFVVIEGISLFGCDCGPPVDHQYIFKYRSRLESGELSQYWDGLRTGQLEFDSRQDQDFCRLYSGQTGPMAHPASYPIQWVRGDLSPGSSGRSVKLTTHLQLLPKSRMMELYLHSSLCAHGI